MDNLPLLFLFSGAPVVMLVFVILTYLKVVKLEGMLREVSDRLGGTRTEARDYPCGARQAVDGQR